MTETAPTNPPEIGGRGFGWFLARLVVLAWVLALLAAVAIGFVAFIVFDHATQEGAAGPAVSVSIPEGATGEDVGRILAEQGLIEYEVFFRIAAKYDGTSKPIRHGVYELPKGYSALQLLRLLYEGPARPLNIDRFRLTIPEGLTIRQISEQFKDPAAFIEAAKDAKLIGELGLKIDSLEGFLMPDTYFFDRAPTERDVVKRMRSQFDREYARLSRVSPGLDLLSVVTVASLVEEEAKTDEERPLIAAVIYNRIDQNMPLQLDATLQYALNKYGQRLLDTDKQVDSPYNTYKYPGLPPGPISNPGAASLRAALQPADVKYIYFVSNADGRTHTFSNSLDEHNRAVERFRRQISVQRRELQSQQNAPATQ